MSLIFLITFTLLNCGSSERVITDEGRVYAVDGKTIKNNGVEVTENLSDEKKEAINNLLERKKEARKDFEQQQNE